MVGMADMLRIYSACPDISIDEVAKLCGMKRKDEHPRREAANDLPPGGDEGIVEPASPMRKNAGDQARVLPSPEAGCSAFNPDFSWYCPTCERAVQNEHVTFQETHDPRCAGSEGKP